MLPRALTELSGVGKALAEKLNKLHIQHPRDLLFHLPRNYQDRTHIHPLKYLHHDAQCLIEADIQQVRIQFGRRQMLLCELADAHGHITLRFFHFNRHQHQQLQQASRLRCFGEVRHGTQGYEMVHPEYWIVEPGQTLTLETRLTPLYSITDGISQKRLRNLIQQVLEQVNDTDLPDLLPDTYRQAHGLTPLLDAIRYLHHPPTDASRDQLFSHTHPAQYSLIFEELLAHRLSLRQLRQKQQQHAAPAIHSSQQLAAQLIQQLPFDLTHAQTRVLNEIRTDLAQPFPMLRLVQGDVGAGKTLVAALAMLEAVEQGFQVSLMAPTEILATQHYENFQHWLQPLGIRIAKCIGKQKKSEKDAQLAALANGEIQIAIGTHALIQDAVQFKQLALIVIDEQHRFGVNQRQALQHKGTTEQPHQLVMTATPIPRTLAMTAYANLDISIIDELPPGRTPITTVLVSQNRREEVIERVKAACQSGRQVYWVCTLIEESESLNCQNAEATLALLQTELPGIPVGLVHGQMKGETKRTVMSDFQSGDVQVLIATTVIEVGVDVPNASLMIIENPERLGLAQLHQLRGRVGRGSTQSFCVLLYQPPLSTIGRERLHIMREHTDGFKIAEADLKIRGPGEMLGTQQTGDMNFQLACLVRDQHLLPSIQHTADQLLTHHPEKAQAIVTRWLGRKWEYGKV